MGEEDHVKDYQDRGDRKPDDSFELPDHVVDQARLSPHQRSVGSPHAVAVSSETNDTAAGAPFSTFSATMMH
jgi:hypothetical protein